MRFNIQHFSAELAAAHPRRLPEEKIGEINGSCNVHKKKINRRTVVGGVKERRNQSTTTINGNVKRV